MTTPFAIRPFTPRQRDVARLIATVIIENGASRGYSYAEIGKELGISEHTVRSCVREMCMLIDGLDALPPRTRIWMITKYPEIADAIRSELAAMK